MCTQHSGLAECAVCFEGWLWNDGTVWSHIYCLSKPSGLSLLSFQGKLYLILHNASPSNFNLKVWSQTILLVTQISSLLKHENVSRHLQGKSMIWEQQGKFSTSINQYKSVLLAYSEWRLSHVDQLWTQLTKWRAILQVGREVSASWVTENQRRTEVPLSTPCCFRQQ